MARTKTKNRVGLTRDEYKGAETTLCPGCGHNSITNNILRAAFDVGLDPAKTIKFSGIGCSSKTPNYFMNGAAGFNSVHGRMPSMATGALLAHRGFKGIGISGDGDTASIGIGQFCHVIRRNLDLVYIVENNGVYGLTKGQFSATADEGSVSKGGDVNEYEPIDLCRLAITLGGSYVARSFSGDAKQVVPLIKGAIAHEGIAILDIISPCVAFNDHEGSTKSYDWVREHDEPIHELDFIPHFEEIEHEGQSGEVREVRLHDGSYLKLRAVHEDHDPGDRRAAIRVLDEAQDRDELATGLLYHDPEKPDLHEELELCDERLAHLPQERVRPSREMLQEIMEEHM